LDRFGLGGARTIHQPRLSREAGHLVAFVLSQAVLPSSRTVLSISLLLACLACKAEAPAEQSVAEQAAEPTPTAEVTMLTPYFEIGEQLASDHADGLDVFGRAVIGSTAQERNDPSIARMHAAAERLGTTSDLEADRAAYRDMSHALLDYLDAHPDARAGLHLMFCPMTFDDQGAYWVARTTKIRNPYEGSRMLECGARLEWDESAEHRKRWAAAQAAATP
jgi:hypothetical protein